MLSVPLDVEPADRRGLQLICSEATETRLLVLMLLLAAAGVVDSLSGKVMQSLLFVRPGLSGSRTWT